MTRSMHAAAALTAAALLAAYGGSDSPRPLPDDPAMRVALSVLSSESQWVSGGDAPWTPSAEQVATLKQIFPTGVCDYGQRCHPVAKRVQRVANCDTTPSGLGATSLRCNSTRRNWPRILHVLLPPKQIKLQPDRDEMKLAKPVTYSCADER